MFLVASPEFEDGKYVSIVKISEYKKEIHFEEFGGPITERNKVIVCSVPELTQKLARLANKKLKVLIKVENKAVQIS